MRQASRAVAVSRYERLLSQLDTELYTTLEALHIHPSALALPAPPLRSSADVPDIFASFGIPERQAGIASASCSHTCLEDAAKGLPKRLVRDLLAAAGNGEHSKGENKSTRDEQPQQPRTDRPPNRHILAGHEPSPPVFFDEDPSPSPSNKRTLHPETARTVAVPRQTHGIVRREESEDLSEPQPNAFRTARSRLPAKRTLRGGLSRAGRLRPSAHAGRRDSDGEGNAAAMAATRAVLGGAKRPRFSAPRTSQPTEAPVNPDLPEIPNVDAKLVEMIMNEMLDRSPGVEWDDIAGLHFAKRSVMEAVVWPMKRPDIFSGLRGPPKGLLLFGPPGTGKTLIGRAIASRSGAKFFNISASSLMSKWVGEGEKLVRALFAVARVFQPSVVFIDEIDSLLTQRTDGEQESSRRVKTEFLVQMDGAGTSREDRVLVVGATNRPQELDEAARRRLVKRLYIPLPDKDARSSLVKRLLQKQTNSLTEKDLDSVAELSKGYSGSDMYALCAEAALGPVRDLGDSIGSVEVDSVRPVCKKDFETAVRMVRASVSDNDLTGYLDWNETFGSFPTEPTTLPTANVNGK